MQSRILVVEDEFITSMDIQSSLENMGFEVVSTASNGTEAIQKAKDLKPDLILMDITLKGDMDGIEAAEKIKTIFDVPIIYMTAYCDENIFKRAKLTEPYGFITKPFNYEELRVSIKTAIYKHNIDRKLKESEKKYRQLFEEALTGDFIATPDGKLLECNPSFVEIYGFANREETMQYNISKFNPTGWANLISHLKNEYKVKNHENWHKRPDGKEIYIVSNTVGVFNDSGELIQVKGYVFDDTERKKAKEELIKTHIHLEEQVEKRTKELKKALNDIKSSNEELEQFAYVASHDLQEPLRTIASFTQLLERRYKGKLDSDADEFMDYIVDAAVRMKQQIQDLLEYSRVATAEKEFEQVDTDFVLNQAIANLKSSIDENKAEITHELLPDVIGDRNQLRRVFQNLIGNAIKYRKPDEPPKIHISAHEDNEKNEHIFSVSDNGIGMEKEYLDKIFVVFQRLHTMDEYQGTGVGLSVVNKVIERHGGCIWVESEYGKGSTFYFTIPLK